MSNKLRVTFEVIDDSDTVIDKRGNAFVIGTAKSATTIAGHVADMTFESVLEIVREFGK